jgi:hypothetical protein
MMKGNTDVLGRFRSLDVGRAIQGLGYDVDVSKIEVIAEYSGYRQLRRVYRGRYGQSKGAIEINFVMQKVRKKR